MFIKIAAKKFKRRLGPFKIYFKKIPTSTTVLGRQFFYHTDGESGIFESVTKPEMDWHFIQGGVLILLVTS